MPAFLTMTDAEAVAGAALRDADLTGLETRVYSSIPKSPSYPLAVVQRIGGAPVVRQYLDGPIIQVSVWGGAKDDPPGSRPIQSEIHDIAQEARVVLFELEGTLVTEPVDAFVTGVDDVLGLLWQPDPLSGRDRYLFSVRLYMRPA